MTLRVERQPLTAEHLRELIDYDPETGLAVWRKSISNRKPAGRPVGDVMLATTRGAARRRVAIYGVRYFYHRVIWLYMTGAWPEGEIDHINADSTDNRWANLRIATPHQNQGNKRRSKNNTSGYKGVSWSAPLGKWRARISTKTGEINLGAFDNIEDGAAAYKAGAEKYFGEFARAA